MPLPFSQHNGIRQFQCFICGIIQPTYAEFKEHIYQNHEEGTEYVTCPLDRCKAPVRDVRAHFKAIHPQEKLPKICQMKSLVWTDPKDPNKKKKKVAFKEGYFVSTKNFGKRMHYNSGWELDVYQILEKMDDVIAYEVEPLKIDYIFEGEERTYLPDLVVYFSNETKEIWEVKPSSQTNLAINEAKWLYCAEYCKNRGIKFTIITEVWINRHKKIYKI